MCTDYSESRNILATEAIEAYFEDISGSEPSATATFKEVEAPVDPAFALAEILVLPTKVYERDQELTLRTADGVELAKIIRVDTPWNAIALGKSERLLAQQSFQVSLPDIWVSANLILSNPSAVGILLNIISSFIYDGIRKVSIFSGRTKLNLYVGRPNGTTVLIEYEGSSEGLQKVEDAIKAALE